MSNSEAKDYTSYGALRLEEIIGPFGLKNDDFTSMVGILNEIRSELNNLRHTKDNEEFKSCYEKLNDEITRLKNKLSSMQPTINERMDQALKLLKDGDDLPDSIKPKSFLDNSKELQVLEIERSYKKILTEIKLAASRAKREINKSESHISTPGSHPHP